MLTTRQLRRHRHGALSLVPLVAICAATCTSPRAELPSTVPAAPAVEPTIEPAVAPAAKPVTETLLASEEEYQGWRYYHLYCARCHGDDVLGSSQAPDLRKSVKEGIGADSFFVLVRDGSTENKEMKGFQDVLDDFRIRQIHSYVVARGEGRLFAGRPKRATPPD